MGDGGGMKELFTLVTVAEARDILARHWSPAPLDQEEVPLTSALGGSRPGDQSTGGCTRL